MYKKVDMGAAFVALGVAAGVIGYALGTSEKYGPLSEIGACASITPIKSGWTTVESGNRLCMINKNNGTVMQFEVDQEQWPEYEDVKRVIGAFKNGKPLPRVVPQP